MSGLARDIENHSVAMVERVMERTYADPFWEERFGERGRFFVEHDTLQNLARLAQSLRFGSPEILVTHAKWLQTVLTTRGLCTRQIVQHFELLIEAIEQSPIEDPARALAFLRAAIDALRYETGPESAVQQAAGDIAGRAVAAARRDWPQIEDRERFRNDALDILSYLADSLALDRPDVLTDHVAWAEGYYARHGRPRGYAAIVLDTLMDGLDILPDDERGRVRARVRAARDILSGPVAG